MDIGILKTEIDIDPETRGYGGMTDIQVADDINTTYRTTPKKSVTGSEVLNAIDKAEFLLLSDTNKQMVWDLVHLGTLNPFGIEADLLVDVFGGSVTITALQAMRLNNVSRGVELRIGFVREGHVIKARK